MGLRGFTYYGSGRSVVASRLDGIWLWAPAGHEVEAARAAVLWGWRGKVDHEPALADLLVELPRCLESPDLGLPVRWRAILQQMQGPDLEELRKEVLRKLAAKRRKLEALLADLSALSEECEPLSSGSKVSG